MEHIRQYIRNADEPIPVVVEIGICSKTDCHSFGTLGPLCRLCPGNHPHLTRTNKHFFEDVEEGEEQLNNYDTNLSDSVRVCLTDSCCVVGFPGGVYGLYLPKNIFQ